MANEFKVKKGLIVAGASGGTVVDVQGSQGQLFSVTDDLSGSIFAVSDISGVPILDVNSSGAVDIDGTLTCSGNITGLRLRAGDGTDGYFYSDIPGRTAFAAGQFYIQDTVGTYYNYATNQYHGNSSGDNHYFRGNPLTGDNWSITTAGAISAASTITASGGFLVPYAGATKKPMINLVGATNYGLWHTEGSDDIFSFDFAGVSKQQFFQSGNATFAGDLTVSGGDITLGGTGRIQGIDTVSAATDAANKTYVDNAVAGVPQGDITAVTAGDYLTGGGTSGDVTLNADSTKLAHIVDSSNGSVGAGWITVAQASNTRKAGEIYVTDGESSDHSYIRIEWMRSYADSNFTVLNCGGHANRIQGVRVLEQTSDTTYGKKYIQIKVTAASNYYVIVTAPGSIPEYGDFIAETPVLENSKTGYNIKGNSLINLQNSSIGSEQGITSGGNIELNDARYVFTTGDVLSLSSGGAGSGTEIVLDDAGSIIKLESDAIVKGEFRVSSLTNGNGDDVFIANSGNGSFTLGDTQAVGDGALISGDSSNIRIINDGTYSLVADSSNDISIPNGGLTVGGDITGATLVKSGGTSSQFLKADGSVDSNTYLTTETGARMVQFTRSGINASTYTMLATVNGDNLASILKMTMTGTSGGVVFACTFDITVNHSTDIHVKSSNGDYSEVTLRITSNNNEDFSIEAKHNGGTTTTAEVCIYPLADEVITPTTTDPGYTGAEYEHTATEGWRFGGEDGNVESSNVIVDGKIGIGTTTPLALLEVKGPEAYIYISDTTETESGVIFRDADANLTQAAAIKYNSSDGKLRFYNNDTAASAVRMTIDTAGNVGIGTTSPSTLLDVIGGSDYQALNLGRNSTDSTTKRTGITFTHYDTDEQDIAMINSFVDSAISYVSIGGSASALNSVEVVRFYTASNTTTLGGTERMRITNAGNVGIGTVGPNYPLVVNGVAAANRFYVPNVSSTSAWALQARNSANTADSGLYFENGDGQLLLRDDGNNLNVRINSDTNSYINGGNLGLGTTGPAQKLTINGGRMLVTNNTTPFYVKVNSTYKSWVHHISSDFGYIFAPSTAVGGETWDWANQTKLGANGVVTAKNFVLSSDKRNKTKIEDLTGNNVDVSWKSFEMKGDQGEYRTGVIAQELEEKHPEFVNTDDKGFKSVKYIDLLIAKIAELEARLEKLEK
jgi:hypothetical protein